MTLLTKSTGDRRRQLNASRMPSEWESGILLVHLYLDGAINQSETRRLIRLEVHEQIEPIYLDHGGEYQAIESACMETTWNTHFSQWHLITFRRLGH
jgi:hypothetical protein